MGGSPYGSSLFNGSMPPYDVPFSGGSPYHFNYSSRIPAGAHYRPLHMSGPPPPYHGGSMMGSGMYFLYISFFSSSAVSQLAQKSFKITIILAVSNLAGAFVGVFIYRWHVWNASTTHEQVWPWDGHGSCCCRRYGMYNS